MRTGSLTLVLGTALGLLGGLASVDTVNAQDDRLPDRSTLLRSDDTPCDGVLIIENGVEDDDDDVRRVGRGQNRVFEVENENISWVCLGENETRSDTMECPAETTHLRIMRRDDDVATFECYGRLRR